ncbi:MAG: DegV family protein, partial [Oscillospiraceae bacterium]
TADRACDLSEEIRLKYNIHLMPFYVSINDKSYIGDEEITQRDIFDAFNNTGSIAKTAARSIGEYINSFKKWINQGYEVVHITISSKLSCSYQNCLMAQAELGNSIHIIDSKSLSTGMGYIVLEAAQRVKKGLSAEDTTKEVEGLVDEVRASFVVQNLSFLRAGGRCSAVAAISANLLSLKPSIVVNNGAMSVGKKYRGKWPKVVIQYVHETLDEYQNIRKDRVFITHSGVPQD